MFSLLSLLVTVLLKESFRWSISRCLCYEKSCDPSPRTSCCGWFIRNKVSSLEWKFELMPSTIGNISLGHIVHSFRLWLNWLFSSFCFCSHLHWNESESMMMLTSLFRVRTSGTLSTLWRFPSMERLSSLRYGRPRCVFIMKWCLAKLTPHQPQHWVHALCLCVWVTWPCCVSRQLSLSYLTPCQIWTRPHMCLSNL